MVFILDVNGIIIGGIGVSDVISSPILNLVALVIDWNICFEILKFEKFHSLFL